jgi:hypothetical protein
VQEGQHTSNCVIMFCLQVMLPQNMATILTLAALQDQQTKAGASAPPHHGAPPHAGGSPSPASGLVIMDPGKGGKFKFINLLFLFATLNFASDRH